MPLTKVHCLAFNDYISFNKFEGVFYFLIINKRAQRALGRSPEEKVKGKRSQWSHLQKTTNIVYQILVEDL